MAQQNDLSLYDLYHSNFAPLRNPAAMISTHTAKLLADKDGSMPQPSAPLFSPSLPAPAAPLPLPLSLSTATTTATPQNVARPNWLSSYDYTLQPHNSSNNHTNTNNSTSAGTETLSTIAPAHASEVSTMGGHVSGGPPTRATVPTDAAAHVRSHISSVGDHRTGSELNGYSSNHTSLLDRDKSITSVNSKNATDGSSTVSVGALEQEIRALRAQLVSCVQDRHGSATANNSSLRSYNRIGLAAPVSASSSSAVKGAMTKASAARHAPRRVPRGAYMNSNLLAQPSAKAATDRHVYTPSTIVPLRPSRVTTQSAPNRRLPTPHRAQPISPSPASASSTAVVVEMSDPHVSGAAVSAPTWQTNGAAQSTAASGKRGADGNTLSRRTVHGGIGSDRTACAYSAGAVVPNVERVAPADAISVTAPLPRAHGTASVSSPGLSLSEQPNTAPAAAAERARLQVEVVALRDTLRQRDELVRKATTTLHEVEMRARHNVQARRRNSRTIAGRSIAMHRGGSGSSSSRGKSTSRTVDGGESEGETSSHPAAEAEERAMLTVYLEELLQAQRRVAEFGARVSLAETQQWQAEQTAEALRQRVRQLEEQQQQQASLSSKAVHSPMTVSTSTHSVVPPVPSSPPRSSPSSRSLSQTHQWPSPTPLRRGDKEHSPHMHSTEVNPMSSSLQPVHNETASRGVSGTGDDGMVRHRTGELHEDDTHGTNNSNTPTAALMSSLSGPSTSITAAEAASAAAAAPSAVQSALAAAQAQAAESARALQEAQARLLAWESWFLSTRQEHAATDRHSDPNQQQPPPPPSSHSPHRRRHSHRRHRRNDDSRVRTGKFRDRCHNNSTCTQTQMHDWARSTTCSPMWCRSDSVMSSRLDSIAEHCRSHLAIAAGTTSPQHQQSPATQVENRSPGQRCLASPVGAAAEAAALSPRVHLASHTRTPTPPAECAANRRTRTRNRNGDNSETQTAEDEGLPRVWNERGPCVRAGEYHTVSPLQRRAWEVLYREAAVRELANRERIALEQGLLCPHPSSDKHGVVVDKERRDEV